MGLKHSGFGRTQIVMKNIMDKVPDAARGQMKRIAANVVTTAQIMVPEDEEHLKDSIRIEKAYGVRGRLIISIVVGGQTVTKASGRVVNLDQYALLVHEAYETEVAYVNGPGPNTLAKMAANPGIQVGSGFLTRALAKHEKTVLRLLNESIQQIIKVENR